MAKKFFLCSVFLLIALCSSAFAANPHLVTIHETVVKNIYSQDVSSGTETDYVTIGVSFDTAEFFCVNVEVVDDEGEMPEIEAFNPPSISFDLSGGKYSFWNSYEVEKVDNAPKTFTTARTDTLFNENNIDETLHWGVSKYAYVPTNSEGDWVHFLGEAETGLNNVTVTWRDLNNEAHAEKLPESLRTTAEQLADFVPAIEYKTSGTIGYGDLKVTDVNWKIVKSSDINTAITLDQDIHFEVVSVFGINNDMDKFDKIISFDIPANTPLEGNISDLSLGGVPYCTIVRYYIGENKNVVYQWRFVSVHANQVNAEINSLYWGGTPSIRAGLTDGKADYTYARYTATNIADVAMWPYTVEAKYLTDGTFTIKGGGTFKILDADGEVFETYDTTEDITLPLKTRTPLGNSMLEFAYMTEGYRKEHWTYINDCYSTRTTLFMDETGSLNGKTVEWKFPNAPELDGSGTITTAKKLSEQFDKSTGGFFPYVEIVSEDGYITAVNYRLVQSPDIATACDPGVAVMINMDVQTEYGSTWNIPNGTLSNATWPEDDGNLTSWQTEFKTSGTLTLKEKIQLGEYAAIHVTLRVYKIPFNSDNYYGHLTAYEYNSNPENFTPYQWSFIDEPPAAETHVMSDEDIEAVAEDKLAEALGLDDEEFNFTERENLFDETPTTINGINYLNNRNAKMKGRFKQLYGHKPGWYVTKITLPPELFDAIKGVRADLLKIFAVPESRLQEESSEENSDVAVASLASRRVSRISRASVSLAAYDDELKTGSLVALDGSKLDTINGTEFLMVSYLEANGEKSNMYLGLAEESETPADDDKKDDDNDDNKDDDNKEDDSDDEDSTTDDNSGTGTVTYVESETPSATALNSIKKSEVIKNIVDAIVKLFPNLPDISEIKILVNTYTGTSKTFTQSELAKIIPEAEKNPIVLETMRVSTPGIYLFKIPADNLIVGTKIFIHMLVDDSVSSGSSESFKVAEEETQSAVFINDNGDVIDTVPASKDVNVAAYMLADTDYTPVITQAAENDTPGSSGGGCNAINNESGLRNILMFLMFALIPVFSAIKTKK